MMIGSRIRQLREMKGISHDDIEELSGLERNYIARIEQGRTVPPLETLERIAAALSVPLYWLFFVEDEASGMRLTSMKPPAKATMPRAEEAQLMKKLKEVSSLPFDADPAFLLDFARRSNLGKPEN